MIQTDNIRKNLLKPDIQLLKESKRKLSNFMDFVNRKYQEIDSISDKEGTLFKERARLLEQSAKFWVGKGTTLRKGDAETINMCNDRVPSFTPELELWLVDMLNENLRKKYDKLTSSIVSLRKELSDKEAEIEGFQINILVPKHSGKPKDGTTVYPDAGKVMKKPADIIAEAKRTFKLEFISLEDAKIALGSKIYLNANDALGRVTEIKTPVTITIRNIAEWWDYILNELRINELRNIDIENDVPTSYINTEVQFEEPLVSESLDCTISTEGKKVNTNEYLQQPNVHKTLEERIFAGSPEIYGQIEWTNCIPAEDEYGFFMRNTYNFHKFDNLVEERNSRRLLIDPKYYRFDDKYFEWHCGADKNRYSNEIKNYHVRKKSADVDTEATEWVTIVISNGCGNKEINSREYVRS